MDSNKLKNLQAPLKEQYKLEPGSAMIQAIRLKFSLETNATPEQMASLKKLTERYCVVYQTLVNGVELETSYHALS